MSADITCTSCGKRIEECACCDEPDCAAAVCFHCLNVAAGQERLQPHVDCG